MQPSHKVVSYKFKIFSFNAYKLVSYGPFEANKVAASSCALNLSHDQKERHHMDSDLVNKVAKAILIRSLTIDLDGLDEDRGGLVVEFRHGGRMVPGSKPDSTEDGPCLRPVARQTIRSGPTPSRWCGVEVWRGVPTQVSSSSSDVVQNYDACPKIALVLL
ncbi:hypothetical protein AVEN_38401-1 [Araneus ventricosus]|uniref:Uncharacterized protein n=1 Tax=Araneus ventricosus TaxID=182803 RepID=A0A4Y2HC62_ARAVE|nr:hypothetical protein AVEN_38401-1 [Araneus ventricosus]